jgi:hypothetical protein
MQVQAHATITERVRHFLCVEKFGTDYPHPWAAWKRIVDLNRVSLRHRSGLKGSRPANRVSSESTPEARIANRHSPQLLSETQTREFEDLPSSHHKTYSV